MKVALAHDYLAQAGGAERVVAAFHDVFPDAPLYTSVYDADATLSCFRSMDVRTSFLQAWPIAGKKLHKLALTMYPMAFEQFDMDGYDVVLSSSSSFAKGIITGPDTVHICYCHTPARFAWRQHEYLAQSSTLRVLAPFMRGMLRDLRIWDVDSSNRVDYFIANSVNVAQRISKCYRREASAVIYPPVDAAKYVPISPKQIGNAFLVVSRLVGYKRIDLAIEACNRLQTPLRIIGGGPELEALKRKAGPTIQFLGKLPDAEVAAEYARCRAFILPGEEDFGITPLEAMASGRPVVAFGAGGALETVVDGKTGLFFHEQTAEALAAALDVVDKVSFVPAAVRAHACKFDTSVFREKIARFVENAVEEKQAQKRKYNEQIERFNAPSLLELDTPAHHSDEQALSA